MTPLIVKHGPYLCGLIDDQMFINGLPLEDWLDNFLPDRELTPKPETFGYCKECGAALCEHDFWFWCQVLDQDEEFERYCVGCLCKIAEASH